MFYLPHYHLRGPDFKNLVKADSRVSGLWDKNNGAVFSWWVSPGMLFNGTLGCLIYLGWYPRGASSVPEMAPMWSKGVLQNFFREGGRKRFSCWPYSPESQSRVPLAYTNQEMGCINFGKHGGAISEQARCTAWKCPDNQQIAATGTEK